MREFIFSGVKRPCSRAYSKAYSLPSKEPPIWEPLSRFNSKRTVLESNYASAEELQLAIKDLLETFREENVVITDPSSIRAHGYSEITYLPGFPHSAVARVRSTDDVVKVVNISKRWRVPLIAYGGATSAEGHFARASLFSRVEGNMSHVGYFIASIWEYMSRHVGHRSNSPNKWQKNS